MGRNGKTNLHLKSLKIKEAMSVFHFILLAQNSSDIVPILASLTDQALTHVVFDTELHTLAGIR